ncbi:unnamed protein product [Rhodiola kirilowii]
MAGRATMAAFQVMSRVIQTPVMIFLAGISRVLNPQSKTVQQWTKFFVVSCLIAMFVDPLFIFLLFADENQKCIFINWPITTGLVVLRSLTNFLYLLHILLQFKLAYVSLKSRDLVDDLKKIARNYLCGYFWMDMFIVLPLPQFIILVTVPAHETASNEAKYLLCVVVLLQYVPKLFRIMPFLAGQSPNGFIFESAWANVVINLLIYMLAGHVVGSCWYLFCLHRVNRCLLKACRDSAISGCDRFIDYCGYGDVTPYKERAQEWAQNTDASNCFRSDGFPYGIYVQIVKVATNRRFTIRYAYSLFWGLQQISTLAGKQTPSTNSEWELLFTMAIIGLGILLFALLIGNMQNFLQALRRRQLEMSLRRQDVEKWMRDRRLPEHLRKQVREAEQYNRVATRGVNEQKLLENLPEDLQKVIRRHLFT